MFKMKINQRNVRRVYKFIYGHCAFQSIGALIGVGVIGGFLAVGSQSVRGGGEERRRGGKTSEGGSLTAVEEKTEVRRNPLCWQR